ncbi:hypothetical protein QAD02_013701 [Eretmocerus hayati]|uniref:Uncharacterized protein n=1 Tax=Eretmocerus hayati TaxID=131215 RepID=A0ACC2P5U9_9HYME|nr:hypothetical protein QAD02_013701 [Eretmocerus hayati]
MAGYRSKYQKTWELPESSFSERAREVENDKHSSYCVACGETNSLSNMGKRALECHMNANLHRIALDLRRKTIGLHPYFTRSTTSTVPVASSNCPIMDQSIIERPMLQIYQVHYRPL